MWVDDGDADGPPPPPFVRRRRRRRNALLGTVAAVVIGVPLVLGVIGSTGSEDADGSSAGSDATDDGSVGDGDTDPNAPSDDEGSDAPEGDAPQGDTPGGESDESDGAPGDGDGASTSLERPDPADHDGVDAVYAELLVDIDESETAMIGFQDALSEALSSAPLGDQDALTQRIRDAAADGQDGLDRIRDRLDEPLDDNGAEAVRESYLSHLDAWDEYMAAIEDEPGILGAEDRTRALLLSINVSADRFARTLEERLPDDVDGEVGDFADAILERGFRDTGSADV